jgi:hypothetical protein
MNDYPFNMIYNPEEHYKAAIDRVRYYEGFKVGKDKIMFETEINEAKESYIRNIDDAEERLKDINFGLMRYMEEFIEAHKKLSLAKENLRNLDHKLKPKA